MGKRILAVLAVLLLLAALPMGLRAENADIPYGDVNGDKGVDMKDVLALRRYIAHGGDAIDLAAADVNVDDSVDMKDVLTIRQFLAHIIDKLGVPYIPRDPYEALPDVL